MRKYSRTTPESRQQICDLYKAGRTLPQIATETGFSPQTVTNVVRAAGITGAGRTTGIRTDPETEALVMSLYRQGVTWREIMERCDVTEHTVAAIIRRNGGEITRKKSLAPEDWERIIALYQDGLDAPEIARQFGCHSSMVYYVLEESSIERREQVACDNPGYFDQIDTPDKAYWLGFIGADGCVTGNKYLRLQIKLARKDRQHLVLLHKALKARRPIRDHEEVSLGKLRQYSTLAVYSPRLAEALLRHGITRRKTRTLQPWDGPANLMPHYWRGMVDGDGSVTINGNGVWISFVGSEAVVRGLLAWAHEVCGTNATARQGTAGNRGYWVTQIGGTVMVRDVLWALYDDAPVALARKKALADLALHGKPLQAGLF